MSACRVQLPITRIISDRSKVIKTFIMRKSVDLAWYVNHIAVVAWEFNTGLLTQKRSLLAMRLPIIQKGISLESLHLRGITDWLLHTYDADLERVWQTDWHTVEASGVKSCRHSPLSSFCSLLCSGSLILHNNKLTCCLQTNNNTTPCSLILIPRTHDTCLYIITMRRGGGGAGTGALTVQRLAA